MKVLYYVLKVLHYVLKVLYFVLKVLSYVLKVLYKVKALPANAELTRIVVSHKLARTVVEAIVRIVVVRVLHVVEKGDERHRRNVESAEHVEALEQYHDRREEGCLQKTVYTRACIFKAHAKEQARNILNTLIRSNILTTDGTRDVCRRRKTHVRAESKHVQWSKQVIE